MYKEPYKRVLIIVTNVSLFTLTLYHCFFVEIPPIPGNFTLTAIRSTSVDLEWALEGHVEVNTFEITVQSSAKVKPNLKKIKIMFTFNILIQQYVGYT